MTTTIGRLLIANRGEIACRIMRTARALGIETVAVYSDADRDALHVRQADEAIPIGPAPAAESYLAIDRIIEAAERTGSDAIHPGYGFLSENATFARRCNEAGVIFVGPSAHAIAMMGDKARAKRAMLEAGVPCVPGYHGEDQSNETLAREAEAIGLPVMIKAAAGGGGRGMRLVDETARLSDAIETARSEAVNAFGAGQLILEKAIVRPRHVEVQILGDAHGTIVHLGERDCSVQRRHQKVIEEAPCPVVTPELRATIGEAAVSAAKTVDYVGAGTVEFLLGDDGSFYFLEMNTRLQVEHPVTELVTDLDLVELQLAVAAGSPLPFGQDDVRVAGHAIEVRLYAEDPQNEFLPCTGKVERWLPPTGTGVRVDAGIASGNEVSPFYDPMLTKVIAGGATRDEARRRLVRALSTSTLVGPKTNRDFLIDALSRQGFAEGRATTAFIDDEYGEQGFGPRPTLQDLQIAAIAQHELRTTSAVVESLGVNQELLNWSSAGRPESVSVYDLDGGPMHFTVRPDGTERRVLAGDDQRADFTLIALDGEKVSVQHGDGRYTAAYHDHGDGYTLTLATETLEFTVQDIAAGEASTESGGSGMVVSPMHGLLLEIYVEPDEPVVKGARLALLEAMKMQHEIVAEIDGRVTKVHATPNSQIAIGEVIIEIEPEPEARTGT